jgi:hypothetical protein
MLTIAYLTFRQRPRFDWFVWSLAREGVLPGMQVLVIDGKLDDARRDDFKRIVDGRFAIEHHPPKPTVWQGPHRLTTKDYFAAANTRNTALALARHPHIAFVDDLSVLLPGWLKAHLHAAENRYVLAGTTCKYLDLQCSPDGSWRAGGPSADGRFEAGQDSRLKRLPDEKLHPCYGSWLYGGTFSLPIEHALAVNGQDEIYDSIGGEDWDFGTRLERLGVPMKITRACGTVEDELGHGDNPVIRLDKPWPGPDGPYSSNALLTRLQREASRTWTLGNAFNLRELRERALRGEPFPIPVAPTHHWVDNQPLSEM